VSAVFDEEWTSDTGTSKPEEDRCAVASTEDAARRSARSLSASWCSKKGCPLDGSKAKTCVFRAWASRPRRRRRWCKSAGTDVLSSIACRVAGLLLFLTDANEHSRKSSPHIFRGGCLERLQREPERPMQRLFAWCCSCDESRKPARRWQGGDGDRRSSGRYRGDRRSCPTAIVGNLWVTTRSGKQTRSQMK